MANCAEVIAYLDALLDPASYEDYGPNGLQVPGKDEIESLATGVSANAELFSRAREQNVDLVLVHHGLLWAGPPRPLDRPSKRRLQLLFDADLGLAAYHLPLDGHLEVGIAEGLDAFVTGEPSERSMARAREAGVHFLAAGHYATETFGVRALGERLAERFSVRHVFIDVPNP